MTLDLFVSRDGNAWRLYTVGWVSPSLRSRLDNWGESFPLPEPDLEALERFMRTNDAPFDCRRTTSGGAEISAQGRSAVVLSVWLEAWIVMP